MRHLPIAMTAGPALLVKIKIDSVAGVPRIAGPDLEAGARITGKNIGTMLTSARSIDDVRAIDGLEPARGFEFLCRAGCAGHQIVRRVADGLFDKMRIDEEVLNAALIESLFNADALEWLPGLVGSCGNDRGLPETRGAIAALGGPDAAWMLAKMLFVSSRAGLYLRNDTFIGAEQGEIAMRGGAGNDFNDAGIVVMTKAFDDVAIERGKVVERLGEIAGPMAGESRPCEYRPRRQRFFRLRGRRGACAPRYSGSAALKTGCANCSSRIGERFRLALKGMSSRSSRPRTLSSGR